MREADGGINGPPNAKRPPGGGRKVRLTKESAWQGQKDLNPRPSVLETDALPTELYPYPATHDLVGKCVPCKALAHRSGASNFPVRPLGGGFWACQIARGRGAPCGN